MKNLQPATEEQTENKPTENEVADSHTSEGGEKKEDKKESTHRIEVYFDWPGGFY